MCNNSKNVISTEPIRLRSGQDPRVEKSNIINRLRFLDFAWNDKKVSYHTVCQAFNLKQLDGDISIIKFQHTF